MYWRHDQSARAAYDLAGSERQDVTGDCDLLIKGAYTQSLTGSWVLRSFDRRDGSGNGRIAGGALPWSLAANRQIGSIAER
jgi:hypothetical protein